MILDFKFHGMTSLADVLVDKLMVVHPELVAQLDGTCLVPVPLHPSHERGRGYNQAELIAHVLSERCTVDVRNDIVTRTDKRKQQAKLALDQRAANVSGAFAIDTTSDQVGGKIAIVDDVVTSGATVREIAKILRAGGYKPIMVISIASNYLW
jgi:ComF family protein